jgi:hypothetical protein
MDGDLPREARRCESQDYRARRHQAARQEVGDGGAEGLLRDEPLGLLVRVDGQRIRQVVRYGAQQQAADQRHLGGRCAV